MKFSESREKSGRTNSRFDNKEFLNNVSYRPQILPLAMLLIEKSRHSTTSSLSHRSFSMSARGPSRTTMFQTPPTLLPEMAVTLSPWTLIKTLVASCLISIFGMSAMLRTRLRHLQAQQSLQGFACLRNDQPLLNKELWREPGLAYTAP